MAILSMCFLKIKACYILHIPVLLFFLGISQHAEISETTQLVSGTSQVRIHLCMLSL